MFRNAAPATDVALPACAALSASRRDAPRDLSLRIHGDLIAVEAEWRGFEQVADCTVFQTFDWLAAWHRHIGLRAKSTGDVDAFHAAALSAGGRSDGAPGIRPHDRVRYYAAFVIDPDGNRIEAVTFPSE